jgi:hypothetical protein
VRHSLGSLCRAVCEGLERPDYVCDRPGPGNGFVITPLVLVIEEKIDCLLHELLELIFMEQIFLHIFFFAVRVEKDIVNRVSHAKIPVACYYTIAE